MSQIQPIGEYQLRNLIQNRVKFFYFDLRAPEVRAIEAVGHPLFTQSESILPADVLQRVVLLQLSHDAPIVLICENGRKALAVATQLAQSSYMNVFVVEGGTQALNFDVPL